MNHPAKGHPAKGFDHAFIERALWSQQVLTPFEKACGCSSLLYKHNLKKVHFCGRDVLMFSGPKGSDLCFKTAVSVHALCTFFQLLSLSLSRGVSPFDPVATLLKTHFLFQTTF
jgi:hypothetical protein